MLYLKYALLAIRVIEILIGLSILRPQGSHHSMAASVLPLTCC